MNLNFEQPWGWLGLLAIPVIIVIYIIKSKYVPKTVSSTFIWKRSLKYVKRKIPLKFIMSFLLVMQILVALAATVAIAKPSVKPLESSEKIIIVDASASMQTTDGGKSRYDVAMELLEKEAEGVGSNKGMTIILASPEFENGAQIVGGTSTAPLTTKSEVLKVIDDQLRGKCTNGSANINAAIKEAESCLASVPDGTTSTVYIYTDKQYPIDQSSLDYINIVSCARETEVNAGILSVYDEYVAQGYRFTVKLGNYGDSGSGKNSFYVRLIVNETGNMGAERVAATTQVEMSNEEELELIFSPDANAKPVAGKNQKIQWISESFKNYEYIRVEIGSDDGLKKDNSYILYSEQKGTPRILLVSSNVQLKDGKIDTTSVPLMKLVLGSFGYVINSYDMFATVEDADEAGKLSGYDLYIFEGVMPKQHLPTDGAVWLLNVPQTFDTDPITKKPKNITSIPGTSFKFGDEIKYIAPSDPRMDIGGFKISLDAGYAMLPDNIKAICNENKVDFNHTISVPGKGEIHPVIDKIVNVEKHTDFYPLYSSSNKPVIFAGSIGTSKAIVSTFDFSKSTIPLFVSDFPILINNMLSFSLAPSLPDRTAELGGTLNFDAPAGALKIEYFMLPETSSEENDKISFGTWVKNVSESFPTVALDELGTYSMVVWYTEDGDTNEKKETFTLTTHIPSSEVNIFAPGEGTLDVNINPNANNQREVKNTDGTWWVILVLVLLLIIEWGVYYRDEH